MHCSLRMQVWVPDAERRMIQATACFFNDASWLKAVGLRMVHPDIDNSTAELLGCKSLRIQHLVCFQPLPPVCWTWPACYWSWLMAAMKPLGLLSPAKRFPGAVSICPSQALGCIAQVNQSRALCALQCSFF